MRRIALALLVLSAAGLFAARANRFDTTAEDLTAFATDVSIEPPCDAPPVESSVFVRTVNGINVLDPTPPDPASVQPEYTEDDLNFSGSSVETQTDSSAFVTWDVKEAFPCGYRVAGGITLAIRTFFISFLPIGPGRPNLEVGLFACEPGASSVTVAPGCTIFAKGSASLPLTASGAARHVVFQPTSGSTIDRTIPSGYTLRLKAVIRPGGLSSLTNLAVGLQWGYLNGYKSALTVPGP